jgi:hypothetical protein
MLKMFMKPWRAGAGNGRKATNRKIMGKAMGLIAHKIKNLLLINMWALPPLKSASGKLKIGREHRDDETIPHLRQNKKQPSASR